MPKLSIITINLNNSTGLRKTIESVASQTFTDYEYIIIDGGSTDGSVEIIKEFADKITYWVSEPDKGIYNAMNKGIMIAEGIYLLFLNSGDTLISDPNILNTCQGKLTDDIVAFDCILERDHKILGKRTQIERPTLFYVYKYGLKHQSTLIKRSLFDKIGMYNENYKVASDYEFWIRCFLQPEVTSRSYPIPLAIYELGGVSEQIGWEEEFKKIEKEWLSNFIADFQLLDSLLPYQNMRILRIVEQIKRILRKIYNNCFRDFNN